MWVHNIKHDDVTSDDEPDAADVLGRVGVLQRVHALVRLTHVVQHQVAEAQAQLGALAHRDALAHQHHVGGPRRRAGPEGDLHRQGGQLDVEVLAVELGLGLLLDWWGQGRWWLV